MKYIEGQLILMSFIRETFSLPQGGRPEAPHGGTLKKPHD